MSKSLLIATFLLVILAFASVWVFEPAIHYYESVNVNTMGSDDFTMTARNTNQGGSPGVGISIVVPAYNEELRISSMLDATIQYLDNWSKTNNLRYEIVVVDDGSTDKTASVVQSYMRSNSNQVLLLRLHKNRGKGAALKMGVRKSNGQMILIADADGATDIRDLDRLIPALQKVSVPAGTASSETLGMVVGSRAHLAKDSIATRAFYRTVLMKGFHWYVQLLVTAHVQDTQCGFKLFTRRAAKTLFGSMHLYRWAFDTELIYLAERLGVPIAEVSVNWHEVDGSKLIKSKLDVVTTSITMARDILCMRLSYVLGFWEAPAVGSGVPQEQGGDGRVEL